jgi:hypothetical protein
MEWELAVKVATIIVGGLTLLDKGYELIKRRRARQRVYRRHLKSTSFLTNLKKKLPEFLPAPNGDLILLSSFMGAPMLFKKNLTTSCGHRGLDHKSGLDAIYCGVF